MVVAIVVLVLGFVLTAACFMAFNHLVRLKHNVAKAWANVDVLLRQRHDELGKLIPLCAEYMRHERELLERVATGRAQVAAARQRANAARAVGAADARLRADFERLVALAEAYPELKANEQALQLQRRIAELESAIADRREFFNATVTINNVAVAQFPYSLLAAAFGMRAFALFLRDEPAGTAGRSGRGASR